MKRIFILLGFVGLTNIYAQKEELELIQMLLNLHWISMVVQ